MDGFFMVSCRTRGMAPSDIKAGIQAGTLDICPHKKLRDDQVDDILDGMLHRGIGPKENPPRCLNITALGKSHSGMPLARIEITTPDSAQIATPAICTYCERNDGDCAMHGMDLYEALKDDPLWNADVFDDGDED